MCSFCSDLKVPMRDKREFRLDWHSGINNNQMNSDDVVYSRTEREDKEE